MADARRRTRGARRHVGALNQPARQASSATVWCRAAYCGCAHRRCWREPGAPRSEPALAALCGASPLQASSGKTQRHRLNRGGDRSANNALWTIAMVRMRSEPRTREYVARRTAQGLSLKEIQRCLKRYIVRQLYPLILADLQRLTGAS